MLTNVNFAETAEQIMFPVTLTKSGRPDKIVNDKNEFQDLTEAGWKLKPEGNNNLQSDLKKVAKGRQPKEIDSKAYGQYMAQAQEMGLSGGALSVSSVITKAMESAGETEKTFTAKAVNNKITLRPSANGGVYGSIAFTLSHESGQTIKGNVIAPRGHEGHEAGQVFSITVVNGERGYRYEADFGV